MTCNEHREKQRKKTLTMKKGTQIQHSHKTKRNARKNSTHDMQFCVTPQCETVTGSALYRRVINRSAYRQP